MRIHSLTTRSAVAMSLVLVLAACHNPVQPGDPGSPGGSGSSGPFRLEGTVVDGNLTLPEVEVSVIEGTGQGRVTQTNSAGVFTLDGVQGLIKLRFRKQGYADQIESANIISDTRRTFDLARSAPVANVSGTMSVTTALTATGGYQYTIQIQLAETAGAAATITSVDLAPTDYWDTYSPFATFGPEAWNGSNIIPANGTLTSKPLVVTVEVISDYYRPVAAVIKFSSGTSNVIRAVELTDPTERMPEPQPNSRFRLIGTVTDAANRALGDVTVEVLDGVNAGRKTTTAEDGTYTLVDLTPDKFHLLFSNTQYRSTYWVELTSNLSINLRLVRQ
jgi:hypothetical protein